MHPRFLGFSAVLILAVLLTGCTGSSQTAVTTLPVDDAANSQTVSGQSIVVTGENMMFSPAEIRVKRGETITIRFTSRDGLHNWMLDAFNASTKTIGSGQTDSVTFVADKIGTFEYYCGVSNHRQQGMVGKLIVE